MRFGAGASRRQREWNDHPQAQRQVPPDPNQPGPSWWVGAQPDHFTDQAREHVLPPHTKAGKPRVFVP